MGIGVEIPLYPCTVCHKDVSVFDALLSDGRYFHEHCYRFSKSGELSRLEKKLQLGTLTVAEAKYIESIQYDIAISKKPLSKSIKPSTDQKTPNYNEVICRPEERKQFSRSSLDNEEKKLENARCARWAWESFNVIENKILLDCPHENLLLSENHDK